MKRLVLCGTMLVCMLSIPLFASDPYEGLFSQVRNAIEGKDYPKALASLRSALQTFWGQSPLLLQNVRFVNGGDNSFGIYEPKQGDQFTSDKTIYLYMEPVGYTLKKNPNGYYEFGFTGDFSLADESGKVLGGQNEFAKLDFRSWNFNTEIALTFDYSISGVEKGKYKIITTVKDKFSDKKATTETWVVFGK